MNLGSFVLAKFIRQISVFSCITLSLEYLTLLEILLSLSVSIVLQSIWVGKSVPIFNIFILAKFEL